MAPKNEDNVGLEFTRTRLVEEGYLEKTQLRLSHAGTYRAKLANTRELSHKANFIYARGGTSTNL